jgi:hypothetical protein
MQDGDKEPVGKRTNLNSIKSKLADPRELK